MTKRDIIVQQLNRLPDRDLDKLLVCLQSLVDAHNVRSLSALAAEPVVARDWLTPAEDEAWADL